jgi:hypothetical protein
MTLTGKVKSDVERHFCMEPDSLLKIKGFHKPVGSPGVEINKLQTVKLTLMNMQNKILHVQQFVSKIGAPRHWPDYHPPTLTLMSSESDEDFAVEAQEVEEGNP